MLPHITKIRDAVARAVSVAALALPACPASPAQAQSVVPCNDVPALISAINAANAAPNLSSILLAPNCVYHLTAETGPLPAITTPVVITGNNATLQRDEGAPGFRILEVGAGCNLTVRSLTVTGGNVTGDGGGIFVAATGTLTGTSVRVIGNASTINGGGIANQGTTRLTFSTVSQNAANPESFGGGIYNSGTLTLTGTNVTGNGGFEGGGDWDCFGVCGFDVGIGLSRSGAGNGWVRSDNGWNDLHQTIPVAPNVYTRSSLSVGVPRGPAPPFDSKNRTASRCVHTGLPVVAL